ncbi:MAG: Mth938-like domain-containing protein [Pseudomonadota bacterium]|jgi:uncharacterized protein
MKLHLTTATNQNIITGYGNDHVMINRERHERSLILLPDRMVENWEAEDFAALTAAHFEAIASLAPELVLLGTGPTLRFPSPALSQALARANIGLEAMDTPAACRTYNILMAEGRKVAAALIIG